MKSVLVLHFVASMVVLLCCCCSLSLSQEDNFACPDEFEGYYPHLFSCDKYWACSAGDARLKTCGNGLAFSDKDPTYTVEDCDYIYNVECGNRTELEPPISAPNCPRLYGTFDDPDDCTVFYTCRDGVANRYECAPGLAFDDKDRVCKWADQVAACSRQEEGAEGDGSKGAKPFKCPRGGAIGSFTKHAHPEDCRQYFVCIAGTPREYGCPLGSVFMVGSDGFDGKCGDPKDVPECANYYGDFVFDKEELVRAGVDPSAVGLEPTIERKKTRRPALVDFFLTSTKKVENSDLNFGSVEGREIDVKRDDILPQVQKPPPPPLDKSNDSRLDRLNRISGQTSSSPLDNNFGDVQDSSSKSSKVKPQISRFRNSVKGASSTTSAPSPPTTQTALIITTTTAASKTTRLPVTPASFLFDLDVERPAENGKPVPPVNPANFFKPLITPSPTSFSSDRGEVRIVPQSSVAPLLSSTTFSPSSGPRFSSTPPTPLTLITEQSAVPTSERPSSSFAPPSSGPSSVRPVSPTEGDPALSANPDKVKAGDDYYYYYYYYDDELPPGEGGNTDSARPNSSGSRKPQPSPLSS